MPKFDSKSWFQGVFSVLSGFCQKIREKVKWFQRVFSVLSGDKIRPNSTKYDQIRPNTKKYFKIRIILQWLFQKLKVQTVVKFSRVLASHKASFSFLFVLSRLIFSYYKPLYIHILLWYIFFNIRNSTFINYAWFLLSMIKHEKTFF